MSKRMIKNLRKGDIITCEVEFLITDVNEVENAMSNEDTLLYKISGKQHAGVTQHGGFFATANDTVNVISHRNWLAAIWRILKGEWNPEVPAPAPQPKKWKVINSKQKKKSWPFLS